ncbi:MAG: hypothetical protein KC933_01340 [Myxococcales bacterium]|nr:hypothetical protein [Myxococcales bacterium]
MTLMEALIAVVVMATAMVGIFGMINHVQGANRTLDFQNAALDAFARVAAQIRDAQCDFPARVPAFTPATTDPGLVNFGLWQGVPGGPVANSAITFVGDAASNPALAEYVPPIAVDYVVNLAPPPGPLAPPTLRVDVRVRQIMNDAAKDNPALTDGYWIRMFPVEKVCAARQDQFGRGY